MESDGSFRMSTRAEPHPSPAFSRGIFCSPSTGTRSRRLMHPVFPMGKQTTVEIIDNDDQRRTVSVDVARPKGKKLHFIEPQLVEARQLGDGLGYLKIAMFPGMVGVVVANQISSAITNLGAIDSLIIDLRGNTGGGIGALRVMSLLTPDRIPVGFALDKRRVTNNLEYGEAGLPAIFPDSFITEGPVAASVAVRSGDAGEETNRASNGRAGQTAVPWEGRFARRSPHRERRRDDRGVCAREQSCSRSSARKPPGGFSPRLR